MHESGNMAEKGQQQESILAGRITTEEKSKSVTIRGKVPHIGA